jgi:hypothetical protein
MEYHTWRGKIGQSGAAGCGLSLGQAFETALRLHDAPFCEVSLSVWERRVIGHPPPRAERRFRILSRQRRFGGATPRQAANEWGSRRVPGHLAEEPGRGIEI